MSALSRIKRAGFSLTLEGDNLKITPSSKLTETQREFLKSHKAEIINELKAEKLRKPETLITCGDCLNFQAHNKHGKGAGICNAGVQPNGNCWWSDSLHECEKFDAAVEWQELPTPKRDAIMVIAYTPNGAAIELQAKDEAHAAFLIRMNPLRECPGELRPVKEFLAAAVDKIEALYEQNIENGWTPS